LRALLQRGQEAMARSLWSEGARCFGLAVQRQSDLAPAWHNLSVCLLGLGRWQAAIDACKRTLQLTPTLWQSHLIWGKASKSLGDVMQADVCFKAVLRSDVNNGHARVALADLYMNTFGQPLLSAELVRPLLGSAEHGEDAELTTIMAGLYDRDTSAQVHNERVIAFRKIIASECSVAGFLKAEHSIGPSRLPLPSAPGWRPASGRKRPRVGLISLFVLCVPGLFFNHCRMATCCKRV